MIALIDADSLLYKIGFALEEKIVWNEMEALAGLEEPDEAVVYSDEDDAIKAITQSIANIIFAVDCEECLLCLSGDHNFRLDLPIDYKLNRKETKKPFLYDFIRNYVVTNYPCNIAENCEADDVCVYLKTTYPKDYVLCAIDKDVLYQTEGSHYNYHKDEIVVVTKQQAIRYAYYQVLVGDNSDGYKGCKGIGHVKATTILDECDKQYKVSKKGLKELYWRAIVDAYEKAGQTEDEAELMMQLANMHQLTKEGIKLWKRPTL